ncbi:hypothetical protein BDZ91DRAFT_726021 [Kalaharituber pfeilii]|nr:hypothetical protein BDZ91DRAFT_726021 [Kalaharituber pfeilii]
MPAHKRKLPGLDQEAAQPSSKRSPSLAGTSPSYAANPPVPECKYSVHFEKCVFEKCVSCIEKQAILGKCRFVLEKDGKEPQTEPTLERSSNGKGKDGRKKCAGQKSPPREADSQSLDYWNNWTFIGNQPKDYIPQPPAEKAEKAEKARKAEKPEATKSTATTKFATRSKQATRSDPKALLEPSKVPQRVTYDTSPTTVQKQSKYTLTVIAPAFGTQLKREKAHEDLHLTGNKPAKDATSTLWTSHPRPLIRILPSEETRSLCDLCATSIFLGSYLCGVCGREYCLGCWEEWGHPDHPSAAPYVRGGPPTILACSRKRIHNKDTMVFVTRAAKGEIEALLKRVEEYDTPAARKQNILAPSPPIPAEPVPPLDTLSFLPVPKLTQEELTTEKFQSHWNHQWGVPLVVTGLLPRFTLPWDPKYFLAHYGNERCLLNNCGSETPELDTLQGFVRDFFAKFDESKIFLPLEQEKKCKKGPAEEEPDRIAGLEKHSRYALGSWKLKDWPPADDFALVFPSLFQDFENALPDASWCYTTRQGNMNLVSRFPAGWNRPDLGPKMYNAYPALDFLPTSATSGTEAGATKVVRGTTNLHLDITDAINILVYASPSPSPADLISYSHPSLAPSLPPRAGAIWDIFPPSAAPLLRRFLSSTRAAAAGIDDPIHRQRFYLSEEDLKRLQDEWGVQSYRVYQSPGEAVFVPAGCAHQVRNVRGAVKVAVDFLSAEASAMCGALVEEGRRLAGVGTARRAAAAAAAAAAKTSAGEPNGPGQEGGRGTDRETGEVTKVKGLGKREDVLQLWNCLDLRITS